jgi:hypothetical protein
MLAMREVRAIYHQGVYAVASTIRQLYEMIETDDERVHRLVAAATAAHLHKIEQLRGRIAKLEEELAVKARQVHRLELTAKELYKELKEARAQTRQARERHLAHLMKDSQNSSMPPSQDRRKRTRSLRERSGRKPGGQVGHPGTTLQFVEKPDRLVIHAPRDCYLCGSSLAGCARRWVILARLTRTWARLTAPSHFMSGRSPSAVSLTIARSRPCC